MMDTSGPIPIAVVVVSANENRLVVIVIRNPVAIDVGGKDGSAV
jgi:hypothetical protein